MTGENLSLEERVAALEALALAQPVTAELTEEQAREFEKSLAQIVTEPWQPQILPPRRPLTEDEVRQLLRECVTVVKPGETLILRLGWDWTPDQMREVQDVLTASAEYWSLGFRVLVVPGEELGVAEAFSNCPSCGAPLTDGRCVRQGNLGGCGWPYWPRSAPRRFEYPVGANLPADVAPASGAGGHE